MSEADRARWDAKFRDGAYSERTHPSALLVDWIDEIPRGRALDVACGAGRNALYLAAMDFEVEAVDISREGLERGRRKAEAQGLDVRWIEHDLDEPLALDPGYALILVVRYLDLALVENLGRMLAPGGCLVCEVHLAADAETLREVAGPSSAAFRARPGELRAAATGLDVLHYHEGIVADPDGRNVALARLVARRPPERTRST